MREALWGGPGFNSNNIFFRQIQAVGALRAAEPALRYGRFYFRPLSGDGFTFSTSPFPNGVLAFARILNDREVTVVANTSMDKAESLEVIVDRLLNPAGAPYPLRYSNKAAPTTPGPVAERGAVTVHEVDGTIGNGPVHTVQVNLQPLEVQVLG